MPSKKSNAAVAPRKYGTINEAAELAHVHPNSIRNWIRDGVLTGYRLPSRGQRDVVAWRVDLNELEELIAGTATR